MNRWLASNLGLYLMAVLIWGSTWIAINFQLGTVAVEVSLVYRYGLASALLFGWCVLRGRRLRFPLRAHGLMALMGLCLFGINYLLTYGAQNHIPSALNAVAFSSMVWMNILNARIFFATRLQPSVVLGAALGIAGVVTLFWPELQGFQASETTLLGASMSLGGAFVASLGNMASQRAQGRGLPVLQSNAWGMLYGTGLCALVALLRGQPFEFDASPSYVLSLLFLAVFGSIVAFGCYLTLLGRIGAHRAGYAVVLFPVVAVALSWLFEGLALETHVLMGLVLVLVGNLVIVAPVPRRRALAAAPAVEST